MFELKEGMKVKTNFKEEILYFNTVDNDEKFWCSSKKNKTSNHFLENKDIDWEETAKLNGIDFEQLEIRNNDGIEKIRNKYLPTYEEATKNFNDLFKNIGKNIKTTNDGSKTYEEQKEIINKKFLNKELPKFLADVLIQNLEEENNSENLKKLNKIPYDPRPTLKEFTKGMNTLFKNKYENLPSLEEVEKELGRKENKGKIRPNLLPITELKEVIKVFEYGVEKYSINNWKYVKDPINEYSNALSRHLLDYLEGEKKASDSNLPHLAHICANALILMWFENNKEE